MKLLRSIIFILGFVPSTLFSQEKIQEEVVEYVNLSFDFQSLNMDSSLFYAKKGYDLSKNCECPVERDKTLAALAQAYYHAGVIDTAVYLMEKIETIIESGETYHAKYAFYLLRGMYLSDNSDFTLALEAYDQALILSVANDNKGLAEILDNKATIVKKMGDFELAQELYSQALQITIQNGDLELQQVILIGLGILQKEIKQYDQALEYYNRALEISIAMGDSVAIGDTYANIANIYDATGNPEKSLYYNRKTNFIRKRTRDLGLYYAINLGNIGLNFLDLNQLDSASYYFNDALELYTEIHDLYGIADVNIYMAYLAIEENRIQDAQNYIDEGFKVAEDINASEIFFDGRGELANRFAKHGFFEEAYGHLLAYNLVKDSIVGIETTNRINELNIQFGTLKNENEILSLSNNSIIQKEQLAKSRVVNIIIVSALIISALIFMVFWNRRKTNYKLQMKNQKIKLLEDAFENLELTKNKIGEELHGSVAGDILISYYNLENENKEISDKLLGAYNKVRNISHALDNKPKYGKLIYDRVVDIIPSGSANFILDVSPQNMEIIEPNGTYLVNIIRELIVNNIKYANANNTEIVIFRESDTIILNYRDNGEGTSDFKKGNGYVNIENFVLVMNGEIQVETSTDNGFRLKIKFPYND